jgi:LPXTG-motif cell wall-anchored protein
MDAQTTVKLVSGILAVALIGIVFLRRKKKKADQDDEF